MVLLCNNGDFVSNATSFCFLFRDLKKSTKQGTVEESIYLVIHKTHKEEFIKTKIMNLQMKKNERT